MKKSVSLISLDSSLIRWLSEKLRISAPDSPAARELSDGLMDLMEGRASSLMLELGEQETTAAASDVLHCGALSIDLRLRRVKREETEIALTPKEFDILYLLYSNPDVTFSKEQIYQAVWHEFSNDYFHAVENTIYQIRKKLRSYLRYMDCIKTVVGYVYKFQLNSKASRASQRSR